MIHHLKLSVIRNKMNYLKITCLLSTASPFFSSSILILLMLVVTLMLLRYFLSHKGSNHKVLPRLQTKQQRCHTLMTKTMLTFWNISVLTVTMIEMMMMTVMTDENWNGVFYTITIIKNYNANGWQQLWW